MNNLMRLNLEKKSRNPLGLRHLYGTRSGIRTLDLLIKSVPNGKSNLNSDKGLQSAKKTGTGQRTVSPNKPTPSGPTDDHSVVQDDLAKIAAAWPMIPDQIKTAIIAIVAPYLGEGE